LLFKGKDLIGKCTTKRGEIKFELPMNFRFAASFLESLISSSFKCLY